jgi:hypothetical protein
MIYSDLKNTIQTGGNSTSFIESIKDTFTDKYEIFLIFFNVIIFMTIQTIFFNYIVSKEYDVLLDEKMVSVNYYLSHDEKYREDYEILKQKYLKDYGKKAKQQEQERNKINTTLFWYYCIMPIFCVLFVFVVYILWFFVFHPNKELSCIQTRNLFLVFFVYTPEILLFLFVIKKYQYIGNNEILSKIYKKLIMEN